MEMSTSTNPKGEVEVKFNCSKCRISKDINDFHFNTRSGRPRSICKTCIQLANDKLRYPKGQTCVHCRRWCKKAKDLSCRKCRELHGLRLCVRCELILPIDAFFYGVDPYCKFCRD